MNNADLTINITGDWLDMSDSTTITMNTPTVLPDDIIDLDDLTFNLDDLTFNLDDYKSPQDVTNERLDKIEKYLGILRPDPEKLEEYDLLKSLYEQYKAAEALLLGEQPLDDDEDLVNR